MNKIKAAYNFVPLEEKKDYFRPYWKDIVSQDIPFRDSVSGKIKIHIKANTAIYIKGDKDEFVNINGQEFIPGTSLKGCIRSVLEILSYGHLDQNRVEDQRFRYRDFSNGQYLSKMQGIHCGWLVKENNKWKVIDWGEPGRISHRNLRQWGIFNIKQLTAAASLKDKYRLIQNEYKVASFRERRPDHLKQWDKRKFFEPDNNSSQKGVLVFTSNATRKRSEFIYLKPRANENFLDISEKTFKDFCEINPDYMVLPTYRMERGLEGYPVFFTLNGKKILTLGLSYIHPYFAQKTIKDALPGTVIGSEPDLADVMFGSNTYNVKGRIQFGHGVKIKGVLLRHPEDGIEAVLNSPRASFYPTYIKGFDSWDSSSAIISGRKRYPIKPVYDVSPFIPINENDEINRDTITKLYPLKEGAEFESIIRFHNLKKEELGALLSALTFHGHQ